jgi:hypothetical protein
MINDKTFVWFSSLLLAILFLSLVGACTHVYQQPIHDIPLQTTADQINVPIKLVITDDFRNAKWEKHSMGDTFIMPLGENLTHHSLILARNVFTAVVAPGDSVGALPGGEPRYLLTPRVVFVEQSFGVAAFSEAKLSIGVEWSLSKVSGEPIWVETIKGEGKGQAGNVYNGKQRMKERAEQAMRNLFENTRQAMLASSLLRSLK